MPAPTVDCNRTVPPRAATACLTMASPSPVPRPGAAAAGGIHLIKPLENAVADVPGAIPMPVSATLNVNVGTRRQLGDWWIETVTRPPPGVNLMLFSTRFLRHEVDQPAVGVDFGRRARVASPSRRSTFFCRANAYPGMTDSRAQQFGSLDQRRRAAGGRRSRPATDPSNHEASLQGGAGGRR